MTDLFEGKRLVQVSYIFSSPQRQEEGAQIQINIDNAVMRLMHDAMFSSQLGNRYSCRFTWNGSHSLFEIEECIDIFHSLDQWLDSRPQSVRSLTKSGFNAILAQEKPPLDEIEIPDSLEDAGESHMESEYYLISAMDKSNIRQVTEFIGASVPRGGMRLDFK